jgi:hypothetical protein
VYKRQGWDDAIRKTGKAFICHKMHRKHKEAD